MPTTQHAFVPLPEEVQQAINLAQAKVKVLDETAIEFSRKNQVLEKYNAELTLENERLSKLHDDLEQKVGGIADTKVKIEQQLLEKREELSILELSKKKATEDAEIAKQEEIQAQSEKQKAISVIQTKEKELQEKKDTHIRDISIFEERKNKVIELLKSI